MRKYYLLLILFCVLLIWALDIRCCEGSENSASNTPVVIDDSNQPTQKTIDKEYCLELFWDIIETQNALRAYNLAYEEMAHRHRAGQVTDEKMEDFKKVWEGATADLKRHLEETFAASVVAGCVKKKEE